MKMKTVAMVLMLALVIGGSAWAQAPVGSAAPTPLNSQNHYKCYDIVSSDPFHPLDASLRDQFGVTGAVVIRPLFHCNPVNKNGEGIPYPDVHLLCYEIQDNPYLGVWPLRIFNQFGWLGIKADRARLLCVPSYKYHLSTGPTDPTDPGDGTR